MWKRNLNALDGYILYFKGMVMNLVPFKLFKNKDIFEGMSR